MAATVGATVLPLAEGARRHRRRHAARPSGLDCPDAGAGRVPDQFRPPRHGGYPMKVFLLDLCSICARSGLRRWRSCSSRGSSPCRSRSRRRVSLHRPRRRRPPPPRRLSAQWSRVRRTRTASTPSFRRSARATRSSRRGPGHDGTSARVVLRQRRPRPLRAAPGRPEAARPPSGGGTNGSQPTPGTGNTGNTTPETKTTLFTYTSDLKFGEAGDQTTFKDVKRLQLIRTTRARRSSSSA